MVTCFRELSPAELISRGSPGKKCSDSSGASCASRTTVCSRRVSRFQTVMAPAPPPAAMRGTPTPADSASGENIYIFWAEFTLVKHTGVAEINGMRSG